MQDLLVDTPSASGVDQSSSELAVTFARSIYGLLQPLEELLLELRQACDNSADLARQTVLALLTGAEQCSEMRTLLVNALLPTIQQAECDDPSQLFSFSQEQEQPQDDPSSFPIPTFADPAPLDLQLQQEPVPGLAPVDDSPFAAILSATEEYSSMHGLDELLGLVDEQPQRVDRPMLSCFTSADEGWSGGGVDFSFSLLQDDSERLNRFDLVPTPLTGTFSPSLNSSFASSPATSISSGSSTKSASQSPTRDRKTRPQLEPTPIPTSLPHKNEQDIYVLVRQPQVDSEGNAKDSLHIHSVAYELTLVRSEPFLDPFADVGLAAREGRVLTLRLPVIAEVDIGMRGIGKEISVVQFDGEAVMEYQSGSSEVKGDLRIFHFGPGSVSEGGSEGVGCTQWWRSQVCLGDHRSPSARLYWTGHFDGTTKKRRNRILEHFQVCRKGDVPDVLREFARAMSGSKSS